MIGKDIEIKQKIQQKLRKISYTNQKNCIYQTKYFLHRIHIKIHRQRICHSITEYFLTYAFQYGTHFMN